MKPFERRSLFLLTLSVAAVVIFAGCKTTTRPASDQPPATAGGDTTSSVDAATARTPGAITICSFNIQWIGSSDRRDNEALATVVQSNDIVVVQELIAPPYPGTFPDGTAYNPDPQAQKFFDAMGRKGFAFLLSEEDTGTGDRIHQNSAATEWWVTFYRTNVVTPAPDLPHGFLAEDRSNHPDFERVPYAFAFRDRSRHLDFVLISVHLQPDASGKARRKHELDSVFQWIKTRSSLETDYIVLGDMNIENAAELAAALPPNYTSLNLTCRPTNTNPNGPKPYDHVIYNPAFTTEMDQSFGFHIVDLVQTMQATWTSTEPYPGQPYDHDRFRAAYSDHNPVYFRLTVPVRDDD